MSDIFFALMRLGSIATRCKLDLNYLPPSCYCDDLIIGVGPTRGSNRSVEFRSHRSLLGRPTSGRGRRHHLHGLCRRGWRRRERKWRRTTRFRRSRPIHARSLGSRARATAASSRQPRLQHGADEESAAPDDRISSNHAKYVFRALHSGED